jgi:hypothetical protein
MGSGLPSGALLISSIRFSLFRALAGCFFHIDSEDRSVRWVRSKRAKPGATKHDGKRDRSSPRAESR